MNLPEPLLKRTMRKCRVGFLVILAFSLFINLLMLTAPIYMLQVFDRVLTSRSNETLLVLTLLAGFAFLTMAALEYIRNSLAVRIGAWIDGAMSESVLATSVRNGLGRTGSRSVQGLRDLASVRGYLGSAQLFPIMDAPWTPIFLIIIYFLHAELGYLAVSGAIILAILAIVNWYSTRNLYNLSSESGIRATEQADAAVRNADSIEAMGMLPAIVSRWNNNNSKVIELQSKANQRAGLVRSIVRFVRMFLQVGILGYGAWLVVRNELTPGGMIAGSILLGRALAPIDQLIGSWRAGLQARDAYRRLKLLVGRDVGAVAGMPLPTPRGEILVEGISYKPDSADQPIIRNVSFQVPAGGGLGIVGPTAAGKSTLARLLVGTIEPQFGHVRLDKTDVAQWDPSDRGRHVGYLPQDVELFDATVHENIARMGDSNPEQVVAAAKLANAHELILKLPKGYDTVIGERGALLSGGQRQRIGLARAVFGAPSVVVLDEPAASLDQEGEIALVQALSALRKHGTTVIAVAHRPHILQVVDQALVMRDGAIEMIGTPDEIAKKYSRQPSPPDDSN
jgi:ATP-binding cassette subfamily B protein/ATP-binding cassette subfamily C protein